jgi:hypothetical protein
MTNHELTFRKIKELLKTRFSERITEFENGTHITLESENENESSIWIEFDESEQLTVGHGISHLHYDPKYDNLNKGFSEFLQFLTCKKRRIDFYKDKWNYRNEYEFENRNGNWENYGTTRTLFYPFWKSTFKKTTTQNGFIDYEEIESEIAEIKNTMNSN